MSKVFVSVVFNNKSKICLNKRKRFIDFTVLQLLQRNIHLGCLDKFSLLTSNWFVYGVRNKIIIIDLSITLLYIRKVMFLLECIVMNRQHVLFFGEYNDATNHISNLIKSCGEQFLFGKWVGGVLTNFRHLWVTYKNLEELKFSERKLLKRKFLLREALSGVYYISSVPGTVFLSGNIGKYKSVVKEAYILRLPIGGLLDADNCPGPLVYPIPSNDDSPESTFFYEQFFVKSIFVNKLNLLVKVYRKKLLLSNKFAVSEKFRKKTSYRVI